MPIVLTGRGRVVEPASKHTLAGKRGQPDLFAQAQGSEQPGYLLRDYRATGWSDHASLFMTENLGRAPLSRTPWRA